MANRSRNDFFLGEREVNVLEILDRWLTPTHRYFKVRCGDQGIYILRYDCDNECWEMTLCWYAGIQRIDCDTATSSGICL